MLDANVESFSNLRENGLIRITFPLPSISCISSEVWRFALTPLTVLLVNAGFVRFGSAAKPALVPISSGVSSIHSAVACVEL